MWAVTGGGGGWSDSVHFLNDHDSELDPEMNTRQPLCDDSIIPTVQFGAGPSRGRSLGLSLPEQFLTSAKYCLKSGRVSYRPSRVTA